MKVTVKTLKGGKFEVEVEESNTVSEVKGKIVRCISHFNCVLIGSNEPFLLSHSQLLDCFFFFLVALVTILFWTFPNLIFRM